MDIEEQIKELLKEHVSLRIGKDQASYQREASKTIQIVFEEEGEESWQVEEEVIAEVRLSDIFG